MTATEVPTAHDQVREPAALDAAGGPAGARHPEVVHAGAHKVAAVVDAAWVGSWGPGHKAVRYRDGRFVTQAGRDRVDVGGLAHRASVWGLALGGKALEDRCAAAGRSGVVPDDDVALCFLCAAETVRRQAAGALAPAPAPAR